MTSAIQAVMHSWTLPVPLLLTAVLAACVYLRGWMRLRAVSVAVLPAWRAGSFFCGLLLFCVALGSPLAALDEELLTVHMVQHLLLMTLAPPLIMVGAPVMPFLHGLPRYFVHSILAPVFRYPPIQRLGHAISQPAFCWLASAAALVGWHIPAAFALGLQSEAWHVVEHSSFLVAGFLFWWPVIQPWPSVQHWPRWSVILYLFLATLPCDILSAYLTFCDRVVYSAYLNAPRLLGLSALQDQECAGALMWTCVTFAYLVPATILTTRLLSVRSSHEDNLGKSPLPDEAILALSDVTSRRSSIR